MNGQTGLIFFAFGFLCAMFGVWKYSTAEDDAFKKFTQKSSEHEVRLKSLEVTVEKLQRQWEDVRAEDQRLIDRCDNLAKDVEAAQVHLAKLHRSQVDLRDRSYPRHLEVTFPTTGAIPIEIVGPTKPPPAPPTASQKAKPLLKKIQRQMKGLSK